MIIFDLLGGLLDLFDVLVVMPGSKRWKARSFVANIVFTLILLIVGGFLIATILNAFNVL